MKGRKTQLDSGRTAEFARGNRWAVILAGGDGTRLQGLTRFISGDDRPKQFCPIYGGQSLLSHTVRRAKRSVAASRLLFALTRTHQPFYQRELEGLERHRIVQPGNRGTAPPILFSIRSIEQADENALVAILPSDHHYRDEERFTHALDAAFEIAAGQPDRIILVGAEPDRPETEYGWIELGPRIAELGREVRRVNRFCEKPSFGLIQELLERECAWNTFVMVGHVRAFRELCARAIPDVFDLIGQAPVWQGSEMHIGEAAYAGVRPSDFSRHVLSLETARLLVLRIRDLGWSDLGHPDRVVAALDRSGSRPGWIRSWTQRERLHAAVRTMAGSAVA